MSVRPMLAQTLERVEDVRYPVQISNKLDGVRCLITPEGAQSRSGKPIPNEHIQALLKDPALLGLDGELIIGPPNAQDTYKRTVSGVMSQGGQPEFVFWVFDDYLATGGFRDRYAALTERCSSWPAHVQLLPHRLARSAEDVLSIQEEALRDGYEGLILRTPDGAYKHGRSTLKAQGMLKLKTFTDAEAEVLSVEPLRVNENEALTDELGFTARSTRAAGRVAVDMLGSLLVRADGFEATFSIGSGFTEAERRELWARRDELPGRLVVFKYFEVGAQNAPRFPIFKGFRDRRDL